MTDTVSGLAVLEVEKEELEEEQLEDMTVLNFGSAKNLSQGDPVIALGNLMEEINAIASGAVTSLGDTPVMDDSYQIIHTDIAGSIDGSGILLDMDGNVGRGDDAQVWDKRGVENLRDRLGRRQQNP